MVQVPPHKICNNNLEFLKIKLGVGAFLRIFDFTSLHQFYARFLTWFWFFFKLFWLFNLAFSFSFSILPVFLAKLGLLFFCQLPRTLDQCLCLAKVEFNTKKRRGTVCVRFIVVPTAPLFFMWWVMSALSQVYSDRQLGLKDNEL